MLMVAPTLIVAIMIAWQSRRSLPDLIHNTAVCIWISANVVWMVGEFYFDDGTRTQAQWLFFGGLFLLAAYYLHAIIRPRLARFTAS